MNRAIVYILTSLTGKHALGDKGCLEPAGVATDFILLVIVFTLIRFGDGARRVVGPRHAVHSAGYRKDSLLLYYSTT
jgi:hypothetical protein